MGALVSGASYPLPKSEVILEGHQSQLGVPARYDVVIVALGEILVPTKAGCWMWQGWSCFGWASASTGELDRAGS